MEKTAHRKERRRYPRFKSFNIIQILDGSGAEIENRPTLVNMSEGGLCFYCDDALSLKDRININIRIAEFHCTVSTYASVVWIQRSTEHLGAYFTGVEFVGINENDRDIIRRLERASRSKQRK